MIKIKEIKNLVSGLTGYMKMVILTLDYKHYFIHTIIL